MKTTVLILLLFPLFAISQVGIGNTDPKATLDISASSAGNPSNTDGLLIPRLDAFPITNPGTDQNGMLVYLTTTVGGNAPGFYYWNNNTVSWEPIAGALSGSDSVIEDTDQDTKIQVEENPDEDIIRFTTNGNEIATMDATGNFGIGKIPGARLDVQLDSTTDETLDQSTSTTNSSTGVTDPAWQSFTAGITGILTKVGLKIANTEIGNPRVLSIYEGEGDTGSLLFSETIILTGGGGEYEISGVNLVAGQKYTIHLNTAYNWFFGNNAYPDGISNFNAIRDYNFKTYVSQPISFKVSDSGVTVGAYQLPYNSGAQGQILTTNGSGTVSWATPAFTGIMETGSTTVPSASGVVSFYITFNAAFTTIPHLQISVLSGNTGEIYAANIKTITTSQAVVEVYRLDVPGSLVDNVNIEWLAIEN